MRKRLQILALICLLTIQLQAQKIPAENATRWVDSVFKSLSPDERIAQLMIVRLSAYDFKSKTPIYYDSLVSALVKQYNVGGLCVFQGNPVKLGEIINDLQAAAKTPLMVTIDAEWGVGMRLFDSVLSLPRQMMLGAVQDSLLIYEYGKLVANQCKRLGIHVNFAPVVDVNNNPENPVINERSFGEDKYRVARYGLQYMRGMQALGVMACAKHFPGHGDVSVDSHHDLPIIQKSMAALDSLELYPFTQLFAAGVGSVMVAHLSIPALDTTANRATSISKKAVTGLLRDQLGYKGLTFTDALEMQGVKKYFPDGAASVESIIAGNDMLCLPGDVAQSIDRIKAAIAANQLTWEQVNEHCKRVLYAKFEYGMHLNTQVKLKNLTIDLNAGVAAMRKAVAEKAITVLQQNDSLYFFPTTAHQTAYVAFGNSKSAALKQWLETEQQADVYAIPYTATADSLQNLLTKLNGTYQKLVVGFHAYSRTPANNYGRTPSVLSFYQSLQKNQKTVTLAFGNPYAIRNFCDAGNLIACYDDDELTQMAAIDFLQRKFKAQGKLPVTICATYAYGSGIVPAPIHVMPIKPAPVGFDALALGRVDSIVQTAIDLGATPGAVVLVVKDGKIAYQKAFGYTHYDQRQVLTTDMVFDMASVTKICATTIAVMRLYEQGKLDLKQTLGHYLPWVRGTNKEPIIIEDLLLHQAGLVPFVPFYKEIADSNAMGYTKILSNAYSAKYPVRVAANCYLRSDWQDSMQQRILTSELTPKGKYIYSDNDFIFLGKVIEALSGYSLDQYVQREFYRPMGLTTAGFLPLSRMALNKIVPTEKEKGFRNQLLQGDVHDPGAAMFGGVAG
ncbi:MAG: hypothetical protein RLY16_1089, partial [Bacteroidota bacterium]